MQSLKLLHLLCAIHETSQRRLLDATVLLASWGDFRPILNHLENGLVRFRPNRETRQSHLKKVDRLPYLRHGVSRHTG